MALYGAINGHILVVLLAHHQTRLDACAKRLCGRRQIKKERKKLAKIGEKIAVYPVVFKNLSKSSWTHWKVFCGQSGVELLNYGVLSLSLSLSLSISEEEGFESWMITCMGELLFY